jgi:hypothetical protein
MHPVYILALFTLVAVFAFGIWNYASVRQRQKTGGHTTGIGGPNDPMAGTTENMRDPDEMRAALDTPSDDLSQRGMRN